MEGRRFSSDLVLQMVCSSLLTLSLFLLQELHLLLHLDQGRPAQESSPPDQHLVYLVGQVSGSLSLPEVRHLLSEIFNPWIRMICRSCCAAARLLAPEVVQHVLQMLQLQKTRQPIRTRTGTRTE